jgi:hypothetical protein
MQTALDSTLPWWLGGPILGLVIVSLLGLANKRFGILVGVRLQPRLAATIERANRSTDPTLTAMQAADVL